MAPLAHETATPLSPRRWLIAFVIMSLLQLGFLLWLVVQRSAVLRQGEELILSTAPVDPRDLFKGDYVTLSYPFSRLSLDKVSGKRPPSGTKTAIWLTFARSTDGTGEMVGASYDPPAVSPGLVRLKSNTVEIWPNQGELFLRFGIEAFYLPEGKGHEIEALRGSERLKAAVRITSDGRAQIRTLLLDGKPLYEDPLF